MHRIGDMYCYGDAGFTPDYSQAIKWYQREADAGSAPGMMALGECWQYSWGVERDQEKANGFMHKAMSAAQSAAERRTGISQDIAPAVLVFV